MSCIPFSTSAGLICLATVLLYALLLPQAVVGGSWPEKMSTKDRDKMEDILSGRKDAGTTDLSLPLFVKYKNRRGKRVAKRHAKNRKFKIVKELNLISLTVGSRTDLNTLLTSPHIEYVEPQHTIHALSPQESQRYGEDSPRTNARDSRRLVGESVEYGIKMVQADKLWDLPAPNEKLTICVIDSGYADGHPDLPSQSKNGVTGTSTKRGYWYQDGYGHGTHCAGVIGAIGNNGIGATGVIRDPDRFKFHIGKALDSNGDGEEEEMLDALEGCINAGAKVVSMSFGTEDYSQSIEDACKDAYDKGVLLVGAAGNDGTTAYTYPASFPEVMSVAAVDELRRVAGFSNYNDQVEITGPGVDIISTTTDGYHGQEFAYDSWTGTSMATPFVAGIAALVWSYFPECTNNQIRNVLIRTAKDEKKVGCSYDTGFGIVQAKDAYDLLNAEGCIAGDTSPSPLSKGAVGGCAQDPFYVPHPTSSPTAFTCSEKEFRLELTTDSYPEETSWELTDSNNNVVGSGSGYRISEDYIENLCLPSDEYTFTLRDSEGDGICCKYGNGRYRVYYDNDLQLFGVGAAHFRDEVTVTFGEKRNDSPAPTPKPTMEPTKHPTAQPANSPRENPTRWPTLKPTNRPTPLPTETPTLSPTPRPSTAPTMKPTVQPSAQPTSWPTTAPTKKPTPEPSFLPTKRPSFSPTATRTPTPTYAPVTAKPTGVPLVPLGLRSEPPTSQPTNTQPTTTMQPTRRPTTKSPTGWPTPPPTAAPSTKPTGSPTVSPTPSPTKAPTTKPTAAPTQVPTQKPSQLPTPKPTIQSTNRPSLKPTRNPTQRPTSRTTRAPTPWPLPQTNQDAGTCIGSYGDCTNDKNGCCPDHKCKGNSRHRECLPWTPGNPHGKNKNKNKVLLR